MNRIKKYILRGILIIVLIVCYILIFLSTSVRDSKAIDNWREFQATLQKKEKVIDGVIEPIMAYMITSKEGRTDYGDTLVIYQKQENDGWKRIYENDFSGLKPWKISISDLDGDGVNEIVTAVRKATRFDKSLKNRLFAFDFIQGKLVKKWTGSEVGGDWRNFITADLLPTKGNELIFVSKSKGGERISVYYWFDFGFMMLAQSKEYESITNISVIGENRMSITYLRGKEEDQETLGAEKGKLRKVIK